VNQLTARFQVIPIHCWLKLLHSGIDVTQTGGTLCISHVSAFVLGGSNVTQCWFAFLTDVTLTGG